MEVWKSGIIVWNNKDKNKKRTLHIARTGTNHCILDREIVTILINRYIIKLSKVIKLSSSKANIYV
jgi:archaellum component FlaG (FlaF/FlaG flagellin family)